MRGVVSAAVPVCYVKNIERSREFYGLFGYADRRSGTDGDAMWCYLQCGEHTLLLASVQPPLIQVELPLLVYLFVDDVAAVSERLERSGYAVVPAGNPEHAPGGEARTVDPDGNGVFFGQRTPTVAGARPAQPADGARSSLIREAAEAVRRRGGAPAACQVGTTGGSGCPAPAEVKLADPWGETVWTCLAHADEALIDARSAFIATEDEHGLGPWLRARRATAS